MQKTLSKVIKHLSVFQQPLDYSKLIQQYGRKVICSLLLLLAINKVYRFLQYTARLSKLNEKIFTKQKLQLIIIELNTQYTPYFVHYYYQLINLKREYGQTNHAF